jgi:acetyl esterase/lipase
MPVGYLITVAIWAVCTAFALAPPRPRHSSPSNISFWLAFPVAELPFIAFFALVVATVLTGDLNTPVGWIGLCVAMAATIGLVVVVRRASRTSEVVGRALRDALEAGPGAGNGQRLESRPRRRLPWLRILFAPFVFRRRDVERVRNIPYGSAGRANLLDVYRHRSRPAHAPTLIHLHGGAFRSGRKSREARPLLYRLASRGWVCVSANYRSSPEATFPEPLVDAKQVIAWVRTHGAEYGADPAVLFVSGSSAGGPLAASAALTPNVAELQPGVEAADTSVTGAVVLYGYFGSVDSPTRMSSSPVAYVHADAPPFFVAHGQLDTIVLVEEARDFVERLAAVSANPVVYAELPGAQHVFDLFHSIRFDSLVDGIEAFTTWIRTRTTTQLPSRHDAADGTDGAEGSDHAEQLGSPGASG